MTARRICIRTRRGVASWLARQFEALCLRAQVRWAEQDRDLLAHTLDHGPRRLRQMDRDLAQLCAELEALRP